MKIFALPLLLCLAGCAVQAPAAPETAPLDTKVEGVTVASLSQARQGFKTVIVPGQDDVMPAEVPPKDRMQMVKYPAPGGQYPAYLSVPFGDGKKHPAIVWITGGDCNSIGDVWSDQPASNDQTAVQWEKADFVMMYPSLRGGNDNAGVKEGFLGEADDVVAAADWLAKRPDVDASRIYLGGHSTGGTLALLVAEQSQKFRAVFAFGPVEDVAGYGADSGFLPFDVNNEDEVRMRSPLYWLNGVKSPTYVLEGDTGMGNIESLRALRETNSNAQIHFLEVRRRNHFSALAPANAYLASVVAANGTGALPISQAGLDAAMRK